MQRKQLLGIILFGIGGASSLGLYYFSIYFVERFFIVIPGQIVSPYAALAEGIALTAVIAFVPFFLIGLGLYLIFRPLFVTTTRIGDIQEPEKSPAAPNEQENTKEISRIKKLSDDELQKELLGMKTIQHVLSSRLDAQNASSQSSSEEMAQMLEKTRDRITIIEEELRDRRQQQQVTSLS